MKVIQATGFSTDQLSLVERARPEPGRGEILIQVRAASLNYRDLAVLSGSYLPNMPLPYVPVSDACGVVVGVGQEVRRFAIGDRVIPCYIQGWHDGALTKEQRATGTLGGPLPGVLQEYIVVPEEDAVLAPDELSDAEASTLPIAAVTAWSCLLQGGIRPGHTVLVQGTGGVAMFATQFAKAAGAQVIALTSTEAKAALLKQQGAEHVINYRTTPDWSKEVLRVTSGKGADIVVETVGSTLSQSMACVSFGGFIGVVGFLGGFETQMNIRQLIGPMVRIQGIVVGSRTTLEAVIRLMVSNHIKPLIDSEIPLANTAEAFLRLKRAEHVGKIVIRVST
jgi:NADPH:quinone reductase-like Zn-dependent oxidoreductase